MFKARLVAGIELYIENEMTVSVGKTAIHLGWEIAIPIAIAFFSAGIGFNKFMNTQGEMYKRIVAIDHRDSVRDANVATNSQHIAALTDSLKNHSIRLYHLENILFQPLGFVTEQRTGRGIKLHRYSRD